MASLVASLRCRSFSDGALLITHAEDVAAADVEGGRMAVVCRTFWELAPMGHASDVIADDCRSSEHGSEATTTLCWDDDDEGSSSDNDVSSSRSRACSSTVSCSPPGNFWGLGLVADADQRMPAAEASRASRSRRTRRKAKNVWNKAKRDPEAADVSLEARTTLLIKNLPSGCNTAVLAQLLNAAGFSGRFNFAYAPIDFSLQRVFGYAFVNFCTPADACDALQHLNDNNTWSECGQPCLQVEWSDPHQGLQIQIARYQNSPMMHPSVAEELRPMLFENGERKAFPEPTKSVKAPRSRKRTDSAAA